MAGKSFADLVRETAKNRDHSGIRNRIALIKAKAENPTFSDGQTEEQKIEQLDKLTTPQVDKLTTQQLYKQVDKSTSQQLFKQLPKQVNTLTSEQVDNLATEQPIKLTSQQVDKSTTTPQIHSTTQQFNKLTSQQIVPFDIYSKPADLKPNQFYILYEIYFKRPFKVHGPYRIGNSENFKIAYGTVRYILSSLVKKGYISRPVSINDGVNYGTTCQINEEKCIPLFGPTHIINSQQINKSTSQQFNNLTTHIQNISTTQQLNNITIQQVDKLANQQQDPSYKLVSKSFKKLTDYIENSVLWKTQGLSIKKCDEWIKEFYPDNPEALLTQLMFAEKTESVLKPKHKTPIHVFYGCLKNGGLTRPKDFEFPEEKQVRQERERVERQQAALQEIENLREKEREVADKLAFLEFLKDKDSVDLLIIEIEKRKHITPKTKTSIRQYRQTGQIDSKLEIALKFEYEKIE